MKILRTVALLVAFAALATAVDLGAGVFYDAHVTSGGAAACLALAQHPSRRDERACGAAAVDLWTQGLPSASRQILHFVRHVWRNAQRGVNTL